MDITTITQGAAGWLTQDWVYGWATVFMNALALIAIVFYVWRTAQIAKATKLQGEVMSRPAVTIGITSLPQNMLGGDYNIDSVNVIVKNHSTLHAKIKVTLVARVTRASGEVKEFRAQSPYDGSDWPFPAMGKLRDHTSFDLVGVGFRGTDIAEIIGQIASSPWPTEDYRVDPPFRYKWRADKQIWVPCVPDHK